VTAAANPFFSIFFDPTRSLPPKKRLFEARGVCAPATVSDGQTSTGSFLTAFRLSVFFATSSAEWHEFYGFLFSNISA